MNEPHADPDPDTTPGLERGGGVPPGETPPAEGSTPDAGPRDTHNPTKGWRTAPLIVIGLVVAVFVVYFLGWVLEL
ncbi:MULTISPECIES: DUF6480 family protein [unclassified Streptomyces]|uniref:DUF6480 family protein n=1 Tax=unclassified Streptomyces TaxID=2593676 RepID=UPI002DDA1811|nr:MULTISPECIES: DUF6480 family protein [unclassified Streptomyces]WSA95933.1 DUF6480 family protein [Streptomyces sp. NBC_01795]WSB80348.1 DUF6480 family protein [Streptomyces sp. NBC_01775]WSS11441.1 DUF6480 family protein [Streptomyces sp. NBC_01186]WSS40155.1 DUF6480 family protein [Streptomyces sp. NBC_01187]